jgi:hypothetical protein
LKSYAFALLGKKLASANASCTERAGKSNPGLILLDTLATPTNQSFIAINARTLPVSIPQISRLL